MGGNGYKGEMGRHLLLNTLHIKYRADTHVGEKLGKEGGDLQMKILVALLDRASREGATLKKKKG